MLAVHSTQREFVRLLDEAIASGGEEECCRRVKRVLEEFLPAHADVLTAEQLRPCGEKYARHLVHRDPAGRYSVLAMVWGVGQGTPLHSHAGMWCVECVYRGHIRVNSYSLVGSEEAPVVRFEHEREVLAGLGDAGALIPPFDYHTIHNADGTPSATIHVYGGDMSWCYAFEPVDGGYRRVRRDLKCTE